MAHLNLRERVIEATIAYVGTDVQATAMNLERIGRDSVLGYAGQVREASFRGGAALALDFRPRDGGEGRPLSIRLVAPRAPTPPDEVMGLAGDADGVVLVAREGGGDALDGAPRVTGEVSPAASSEQASLPVIVQLDRRPDAPVGRVARETDTRGLPCVVACIERGEGVMETLAQAIESVVESMHGKPSGSAGPAAPPPTAASRASTTPLVTALRQMLQASMSEQLQALETRLSRRMDDHAAATRAHVEASLAEARSLATRSATLAETLGDVSALQGRLEEVFAWLVDASARAGARAESQQAELAALGAEIRRTRPSWFR